MAIIQGTSGNDNLNGTPENDQIYGLAGNDTVYGYDSDDFLDGGDDSDYIEGGNGNDWILGGNGNDGGLWGGSGDDRIYGEAGLDTLRGGDGNDFLDGGDDNDELIAGSGNDNLFGGNSDDTLEGEDGDDTLSGDRSNDKLSGGRGNDTLSGGDGDDELNGGSDYLGGKNEIDRVFGNAGKDTFAINYSYDDADPVTAGTADYALIKDFNSQEDFIQLNGAKSNYFLAASPNGLPTGTAIYSNKPGNQPDELLAIVENSSSLDLNSSYFTTTVDDRFSGSDGDDYFDAGIGDDGLNGYKGNDTLIGGDGNDYIVGYTGNDSVSGGNGNDVLVGTASFSPLDPYFVSGSPPIVGNGEIDNLTGGAGADYFRLGEAFSLKYAGFSTTFYDDRDPTTAGTNDYALITDFNSSEDKIALLGLAEDYTLQSTSGNLPTGTGIYINKAGNEPDELIGIMQGTSASSLNLSASYFSYENPQTF
ncbi:MAG TPA: calcium-binding protein [Leptolyngbyaceae cyanobacterium]